jgi:hypothetical protein
MFSPTVFPGGITLPPTGASDEDTPWLAFAMLSTPKLVAKSKGLPA